MIRFTSFILLLWVVRTDMLAEHRTESVVCAYQDDWPVFTQHLCTTLPPLNSFQMRRRLRSGNPTFTAANLCQRDRAGENAELPGSSLCTGSASHLLCPNVFEDYITTRAHQNFVLARSLGPRQHISRILDFSGIRVPPTAEITTVELVFIVSPTCTG